MMLDELFMHVLDMTKAASIVILVVMVARLLLRKMPKIFSYALWIVVLFRLLCPVSLEVPISLVPELTSVSEGYSLTGESISLAGAGEAAYRAVGDAINGGLGIQHIRTTEKDVAGMTRYVATDWWDVWILFGQYIWVLGIAAMVVYSIAAYRRLKKSLAVKICLRDNIYIADDIHTPFVKGIIKPEIYLPPGLEGKEQEYIILHEQHHIKRKDSLVKALAFLALSIHWFNPLVWAAFILANKDMEMSCDEAVIRRYGQDIRADYAASLLTYATGRRMIAGTPLAFGEGDTKSRIKNLASWKRPAVWILIVSGIVCVGLCMSLMGNLSSKNAEVLGTKYEIPDSGLVKSEDVSNNAVMVPTSADMTGAFDSYLYVPLEGENYRYERTELGVEKVTADSLLYSFTEESDPADVEWEVYTLQEYPDISAVLAIAGEDYQYVYQYSPSKRSEPEALDRAIAEGCVVHVDGDVTNGQEAWQNFLEIVGQGKAASVQVADYYTLDKEHCSEQYYEAYKEDYPVLYRFELLYDGNDYTLKWKEGNTEYVRNYQYLMHYTGDAPTSHATYDSFSRYVLTNDNTVTWDDILQGMFSSQWGDYIDHNSVYEDLQ